MSESAPRQTAQADAKQTDAKQAKAAASPDKASTDKASIAEASIAEASTAEASTAEADASDAGTQQATAPDADGKPDIDEVKRKFREALDKKREIQAEASGAGGRNTGKIHGAHGSEDHRRTFRRKSG